MSNAVDPPVDPAILAEAHRQHQLIMRGTRYGDDQTGQTMAREMYERLVDSLTNGRPLRVYLGVDPTSPDLHIGHCVALRKLQLFQQLGHQAILLIGDFTGLVGDPSDKDSARPMQAAEILARNARTYREQAYKLLDPARTEVHNNSEWLAGMSFADVIQLASNFTVQQFTARDNFKNRMDTDEPVYVHEFMYGLMQGYDAVALNADVQLGGTDQTFNIFCGRTLQVRGRQAPQVAVLTPILVGTNGVQRMSKSMGNYIGIDEQPIAQYGKAMSIPDSVMDQFFIHGTNIPHGDIDRMLAEVESGVLAPMDAKRRLARAIVSEWHGLEAASAAEEEWTRQFSRGEAPADIPEFEFDFGEATDTQGVFYPVSQLLKDLGAANSMGEAKRLLEQGAVRINGTVMSTSAMRVYPGDVVKVGKRRWYRIQRR